MNEINLGLIISFCIAILVDFAAPLLLAAYLSRRYHAPWRYWWYGVLVFLVFQGVTRIPVMLFIQSQPSVAAALQQPGFFWSFLAFAAFTAGLFEEGGRWLALRYFVRPTDRTRRNALMLGAGHGGLESLGVGLATLAGLAGYLAIHLLPAGSLPIPGDQLDQAGAQFARLHGWEPLLGGWERLMALLIQISLTVMVQRSFVHGARWWWYALAAHTLIDFTAVGCLQLATKYFGSSTAMLLTELLVTIYGIASCWLIRQGMASSDGSADGAVTAPTSPARLRSPTDA